MHPSFQLFQATIPSDMKCMHPNPSSRRPRYHLVSPLCVPLRCSPCLLFLFPTPMPDLSPLSVSHSDARHVSPFCFPLRCPPCLPFLFPSPMPALSPLSVSHSDATNPSHTTASSSEEETNLNTRIASNYFFFLALKTTPKNKQTNFSSFVFLLRLKPYKMPIK